MFIKDDISLRDFKFWSGAKEKAVLFTDEELDTIEQNLEKLFTDGMDATKLNDLFWFECEQICDLIGITNEKIKIGFYAGESRYKEGIVNYLISLGHIEPELYAEIIVPEECFDDEGEWIWSSFEGKGAYTGNVHWKIITYILDDEEYLYEGFVCLGVSPIAEPQEAAR